MERTFKHIQRVQNNALYLILNHCEYLELDIEECRELAENILHHDNSKFSVQQFQPYIDFSWIKKTKGNLTDKQQDAFDKAWKNHYTVENHHPEQFKGICGKLSKVEIIEIACDLQAMAQEFGEGDFLKYLNNKWVKDNSQYFYDDFDWGMTKVLLRKIGNIFEVNPTISTLL